MPDPGGAGGAGSWRKGCGGGGGSKGRCAARRVRCSGGGTRGGAGALSGVRGAGRRAGVLLGGVRERSRGSALAAAVGARVGRGRGAAAGAAPEATDPCRRTRGRAGDGEDVSRHVYRPGHMPPGICLGTTAMTSLPCKAAAAGISSTGKLPSGEGMRRIRQRRLGGVSSPSDAMSEAFSGWDGGGANSFARSLKVATRMVRVAGTRQGSGVCQGRSSDA